MLLRYSLQKVILCISFEGNRSWPLFQGYVPLPKSSSKERIVANTQIFDFELTVEEMVHLDTLDEGPHFALIIDFFKLKLRKWAGLVTDWDPTHDP